MNTLDIERLLLFDERTKDQFGGALASDEFEERFDASPARLFVVNTQDSSKKGEHWLGVYKTSHRSFLFDMYGLPAQLFPKITKCIISRGDGNTPLVVSDVQLQSLTSTVCGDYCVLFCLAMSRGVSFESFLRYWESMLHQPARDWLVRNIILEYLCVLPAPHAAPLSLHNTHNLRRPTPHTAPLS